MATLKVKQFRDDVWIPDTQAQEIMKMREEGNAPKRYTFGSALQIFDEDIRGIMLDTHPDSPRRASPSSSQKTERDMSYMSRKRTPEEQERVNEELRKIKERFNRGI